MKKYNFQILRYIHDYTTGEFVNVGLLLYEPESKYLLWNFTNKYSRISQFFGDISGTYLLRAFRNMDNSLKSLKDELTSVYSNKFLSIEQISSRALQRDDSSLIFSQVYQGLDVDLDIAASDLYQRLVNHYIEETNPEVKTDSYAWRKVYKDYFDKFHITGRLKPHLVNTTNDVIKFDKAWKNGAWNCFESISFDLKTVDSIKSKVYKWSGILDSIKNSSEPIHIYFLSILNSDITSDLKDFIFEMLLKKSNKLKVTIIIPSQAEKFAKQLQQNIASHHNDSDLF